MHPKPPHYRSMPPLPPLALCCCPPCPHCPLSLFVAALRAPTAPSRSLLLPSMPPLPLLTLCCCPPCRPSWLEVARPAVAAVTCASSYPPRPHPTAAQSAARPHAASRCAPTQGRGQQVGDWRLGVWVCAVGWLCGEWGGGLMLGCMTLRCGWVGGWVHGWVGGWVGE